MFRSIAFAIGLALLPLGATAQTTTMWSNGLGGYTVNTPGQPTTTVWSNGLGGYTVNTPGQPTSTVWSNGLGGYTVNTPQTAPPGSGYGYRR